MVCFSNQSNIGVLFEAEQRNKKITNPHGMPTLLIPAPVLSSDCTLIKWNWNMFSMSVQSNLVSFTESVLLLTKIYYWNIILQRRNTTPNACITVTDTQLFIWLIMQPPCTLTKQCLYLVGSAHYVLPYFSLALFHKVSEHYPQAFASFLYLFLPTAVL